MLWSPCGPIHPMLQWFSQQPCSALCAKYLSHCCAARPPRAWSPASLQGRRGPPCRGFPKAYQEVLGSVPLLDSKILEAEKVLRPVYFGGCSPVPCICVPKGPVLECGSCLHKPSHMGIFPWILSARTGVAGRPPSAWCLPASSQSLPHLMHMCPWGQPAPLQHRRAQVGRAGTSSHPVPLSLHSRCPQGRASVWGSRCQLGKNGRGGRDHRRGVPPGGIGDCQGLMSRTRRFSLPDSLLVPPDPSLRKPAWLHLATPVCAHVLTLTHTSPGNSSGRLTLQKIKQTLVLNSPNHPSSLFAKSIHTQLQLCKVYLFLSVNHLSIIYVST